MKPLGIVRPTHPRLGDIGIDFKRCLDSGEVTNNGRYVRRFEEELTKYLGLPTIVFSSGHAALMAMLMAGGVKPGGEVICPSFTFCSTPHAIVGVGAIPRFVDINAHNLCLNSSLVEKAINPSTGAIVPVEPYGISFRPSSLGPRAQEIPILIDSAPAFGSKILGSPYPPVEGTAHIFSFHATKPFSTMEGGALCSRDIDLIEMASRIRNFGQNADGNCEVVGFNGKMMELCAIMGLKQLERWYEVVARRVSNADHLGRLIEGIEGVTVIQAPSGQAPIWLYRPILIDEEKFGLSRDAVAAEMAERGIHVRKYYSACHLMTCYRGQYNLPVTERIASQVISLPVYNNMNYDEIGHIVETLRLIRRVGARA